MEEQKSLGWDIFEKPKDDSYLKLNPEQDYEMGFKAVAFEMKQYKNEPLAKPRLILQLDYLDGKPSTMK